MADYFDYLWRNKFQTIEAKTIDDFIAIYEELTEKLKRWKTLGIELDSNSRIEDDYAMFFTEDEKVAKQEGFELTVLVGMED